MVEQKSANMQHNGNGNVGSNLKNGDSGLAKRSRALVIPLSYPDKDSLYKSYMSFLKKGGLFLPTSSEFEMDEELFLLVTLLDNPKPVSVSGNVVWRTPIGSVDGQKEGVGVEFKGKDGEQLKGLIEGVLGGAVNSPEPTFTM